MSRNLGSGRVAFTARIPEELHTGLRRWCVDNKTDLQDALASAVAAWLNQSPERPLLAVGSDELPAALLFLRFMREASQESRGLALATLDAWRKGVA